MKASDTAKQSPASVNLVVRTLREGALIGLVALCAYLLMSLFSYSELDPGWSKTGSGGRIINTGGPAGAWLADVFFALFGYLAFLFPFLLAYRAWLVFRQRARSNGFDWVLFGLRCVGFFLVMVAGCGLAGMHFSVGTSLPFESGGLLGASVATAVAEAFSYKGGTLLLLSVFLFGITIFTDLSWLKLMDQTGRIVLLICSSAKLWVQRQWSKRRERRQIESVAKARKVERKVAIERQVVIEAARTPVKIEPPKALPKVSARIEKEKQKVLFDAPVQGDLPPISLLDPADDKSKGKGYSKESLEAMSKLLELKLKDFNIVAEVISVLPGPVVTRFEMQPAPGIKASRITGLSKDLARSLAVVSVRVVEVIPGKSFIGIEIPNEHREIVRMSEVVSSELFDKAKSPLTMALGHDIGGEPVIADLAKMPHLLVAGTTGSGKSVGVNVMLLSLLYKSSPKDVRLILVDPKMLELSVYEGIPHLLTPVITDMNNAANGLRWSVGEMERRYKLMAALGVRNLAGYNRKIEEAIKAGEPIKDPLFIPEENYEPGSAVATAPDLETLPCVVIVIDEFADMMMIVGKKVEQLIARIAQKARAAGIHLILATQRPSVDVITGLIKANVPTRIAFQVSSKIDSRTILDQGGAEQLLGHGDMLYLPPGTSVPVRVHGAFVDDHEVHAVVNDWKKRGAPDYLDAIVDDSVNSIPVPGLASEGDESNDDPESDALYDEAVAFVLKTRKPSISSVQRKLRIGYNRAARLIEAMEAAGLISEMGNNGQRDVLTPE